MGALVEVIVFIVVLAIIAHFAPGFFFWLADQIRFLVAIIRSAFHI